HPQFIGDPGNAADSCRGPASCPLQPEAGHGSPERDRAVGGRYIDCLAVHLRVPEELGGDVAPQVIVPQTASLPPPASIPVISGCFQSTRLGPARKTPHPWGSLVIPGEGPPWATGRTKDVHGFDRLTGSLALERTYPCEPGSAGEPRPGSSRCEPTPAG